MPFKLNQDRRHHIPRQTHKVTNWPAYEAGLRQRGSLTVWFSNEAIQAWVAEPRVARGRQPWYSPLAILTALTLHVPDHTTLSRRSATLAVPRPPRPSVSADGEAEPLHLLVDSTGLKLCGPGEWLVEKHGTRARRSWQKLHLGIEANTGQIVAASVTAKEVDDGAEVGPLLDQVDAAVAAFVADGGYDQGGVYTSVAQRHPDAAVVVPRTTAVPSETAETAPTQRDRHLQHIVEHGRRAWQKTSDYTRRALAEATIGRWKQVIGDGLRAYTDEGRATEVKVAVYTLNRMLELGRPNYVHTT